MEFWREDHWKRRDFWAAERDTTNNRMALGSAIMGLGLLKRPCRVRFVSDSQYLVKGITEWLPRWKARGWKRKGGPPENLDLWKELDRASARHRVEWTWVRGHAGHPRNEYANHLAVRAARSQGESGGLVASGFKDWLETRREEQDQYMDFFEDLPPGDDGFPPDGFLEESGEPEEGAPESPEGEG